MSEAKCEGCGARDGNFKKINVTNGVLNLCRQCLDDVNRKNPELIEIRAALAKWWIRRERLSSDCKALGISGDKKDSGRWGEELGIYILDSSRGG
jgi:ribosome-binding protein aMBF1 (putative translation factor)